MPPRVYDWHDDPTGTFLAAPQIRARFTRYEPGGGYRNYHTHEDAGPLGAWETWVVLEGAVAFDFDGTEVIVRRGQAVTAAPHEKHRDRCASDEPALAFLCVTPHTPPTHTHYDDDGTQRPARAGVAAPTWRGQPPLGQEQSAPVFAAWEAAHGQPSGAPSAMPAAGATNGQPSGAPSGASPPGRPSRPSPPTRGATSPAATASPRPSATGPPSRPRPGGASCWPSATPPRPRTPSTPGCA